MTGDLTKDDVIYALKCILFDINKMDDQEFRSFEMGMSLTTDFRLPHWKFKQVDELDCPRRSYNLELKLR